MPWPDWLLASACMRHFAGALIDLVAVHTTLMACLHGLKLSETEDLRRVQAGTE